MNEYGDHVGMEDDRGYSIQELAGILMLIVLMTTIFYFAIIHHPSVIARQSASIIQRISLLSTAPAVSIYILWKNISLAMVKCISSGRQCAEDVVLVCLFQCAADLYCFQTCAVLYGQCDARA